MSHYSNSSVIARIMRQEGVDAETARRWFDEMLVFLDMAAQSDELISPPKPDPDAYRRAFERRSELGTPVDPLMWAVPAGLATGGGGGDGGGGGGS